MRGVRDFIIKYDDFLYSKTFKMESGLELHADVRFSPDRLSNKIATVLETPLNIADCDIKKGYQVMVDPTVIYGSIHSKAGELDSPFTIDKQNRIFKVSNSMILLYRENENKEWVGYDESILVKYEKEKTEDVVSSLGIITELKKNKTSDVFACVVYLNQKINDLGVNKGDRLFIKKHCGLPFLIDGIEYEWVKNENVLAILN